MIIAAIQSNATLDWIKETLNGVAAKNYQAQWLDIDFIKNF